MTKFKLIILSFFITTIAFGQTEVKKLTVEQQSFPIGIATVQPRFSWQLQSDQRNLQQTSYEILVASSKANLEKNVADVWSSGNVKSDVSVLQPFTGSGLKSNTYYYWKVKVTTNNGESVWSKPTFFTIGFVDQSNWKAKWIGYDKAFPWDSVTQWSRLSARYFRKEFSTPKKIKKAYVNIVGLGLYDLMINGKKIGDQVLAPAPTDYRKTMLSNTFDVSENINEGKNAIGIVIGNGRLFTMRQNYKPHKINNFGFPKLLFQLDLIYEDDTRQTIISDESWKFTADGPIRTNNEYDGEEYDATKELGDWTNINFNDSKWLKPQLLKAPAAKVVPQPNPPMKIMDVIKPVSIKKVKDGLYILDMGQNLAGWLQLKVTGTRGQKVKLRFAESLQPNGELYVANLRDARVTDIYTLKGGGVETWHPSFVYHGFSYVEITGYPGEPVLENFEGHLVFDNMKTTGQLETSNKTINQILKNSWWGIATNYKGMPVDCPQRNERQPWLGDRSQGAYGESFLFDNASLYAKWLDDIEQSQTKEGSIPDVAPAYWNYYSDNVTWPGTYFLVAEMLYDQFGDKQSIVKHYASMKKWLTYMRVKYMKNFIVTKDKYGDWCVPPESLEMIRSRDSTRNTNGELISTAAYYHLLQVMKKFAALSNNHKDIAEYDLLAGKMKEAFNKRFFKSSLDQYDNNTVTANLLGLRFGLTPKGREQGVFQSIIKKLQKDDMHISTGVIGTQWLMRTLTDNGRPDAAFTLAGNTTYPSWGYMIENGATTIWELWNGNTANPQMNSQNHVMLLGDLLIWMYEDLAGIKTSNEAVAFKKIIMKPAFGAGLQYTKASYQSPYGEIKSDWSVNGRELKWDIVVPANTTAVVYLPAKSSDAIKEAGKDINTIKEIKNLGVADGAVRLEVGSGAYSFTVIIGE